MKKRENKLKLELTEVHLINVFHSVCQTILSHNEKLTTLTWTPKCNFVDTFVATMDIPKFKQICIILLNYTIQHTLQNEAVNFTLNLADLDLLEILVTNTGNQIPYFVPQKNFLPFQRRRLNFEISPAKEFVEFMDGTIQYEYTESIGNRFTVHIPISDLKIVEPLV